MDTIEKFTKVLELRFTFSVRQRIHVAVSGGLDSVVLLDLLFRVRSQFDLSLDILHLNHGIRGDEADRDQRFVEKLAKDYCLKANIKVVNTPEFAKKTKRSMEEAARILRYRFFEEELDRSGEAYIALGHHADDQAETILDRFLRGSGIRGLGGMRMIRDYYIRPLLAFTRAEIEAYAQQYNLRYRDDSSNRDLSYKRNRIRHELIPMLKRSFNPSIVKSVISLGDIMKQNELFLRAEAEKAFDASVRLIQKKKIVLEFNQFLEYFDIIKIYILFKIQELLNVDDIVLSFERLTTFLDFIQQSNHGKLFEFGNDCQAIIDHDGLVFQTGTSENFEFEICRDCAYEVYDGEKVFKISNIAKDDLPQVFVDDKSVEYIDADAVIGPLILRNYHPGDVFTPLNMLGRKKVSDYFTDNKVPLHMRNLIPILSCKSGIVCIAGYQIDDHFKVTKDSVNILKLELRDVE
ncbi:MAG: tRNA lysidine(34) synthetase TilS [candidate division KSB1 bacterium]|jgi:tRNA(Ile)-lysidine synthase|nr:tRNA lysidine(34) synthetase TilS [candidate division KSB1 bacterium]